MPTGEGKGWAKGRTAGDDARVARNAERHRGMAYTPRLSSAEDGRRRNRFGEVTLRTLGLSWSPVMAYVVGLMATDGCLLEKKRQLNFKSEDEQLVETFLTCLGKPPRWQTIMGRAGKPHYVTQFGDRDFYIWLEGVGLMPRKSLVLGPLSVPDELLVHCARGLLDGDGSLLNYWYDGTGKARGRRYEGFATVFNSASRDHLAWLRAGLSRVVGVNGALSPQPPTERGTVMWRLAYAIRESSLLLPRMYPTAHVPCLVRKWLVWRDYSTRHELRTRDTTIAEAVGRYLVA